MAQQMELPTWLVRDPKLCSGCRLCEIICSLHHEGRIWTEASRVRVFMLVPGIEVAHVCAQCSDYPCVEACPVTALSVDEITGAVIVDQNACTGCGTCIDACPGKIPYLHPSTNKALICDLCGGDPECAKICTAAGFGALKAVKERPMLSWKLYSVTPEELTEDIAINLYGEKAKELI